MITKPQIPVSMTATIFKTKIKFILTFLFLFTFVVAKGQQKQQFPLEIEIGANNYGGDFKYIMGESYLKRNWINFRLKSSFMILKNHIEVASGIQYMNMGINFHPNDEVMYLQFFKLKDIPELDNYRYKMFKIKTLKENNSYIGIPLELHLYPYYWEKFTLYVKTGIDFNYRFAGEMEIDFLTAEDEALYEDAKQYDTFEINNFLSSFFWGIGAKFGRPGKVNFAAELLLPSIVLTSDNMWLMKPDYFVGINAKLIVPLR